MCETGAGCVPVGCYLCCLGHRDNGGHRILSSSENTNLRLTFDLKESQIHRLCCNLDWSYLSRFIKIKLSCSAHLNRNTKCNYGLGLQNQTVGCHIPTPHPHPTEQQIYTAFVSFTISPPSHSPLDCISCSLSSPPAACSNGSTSHCLYKQVWSTP